MPTGVEPETASYRRRVPANPEAIAWYLKRSEALLDGLHRQVESLRTRGAQIAGFAGAILALAGPSSTSALDSLSGLARGGAGISLMLGGASLMVALAVALRGCLAPELVSDNPSWELANFTSERFIGEPELWRVQARTIRILRYTFEASTRHRDRVAKAIKRAEIFFLVGLFSVGVSSATFVGEVIL